MKELYELWFSLLKMSYEKKQYLMDRFTEEEMYLSKVYIKDREESFVKAKELLNYINKNNLKYITYRSDRYPEDLKNLKNPPYILYYKGNIDLLKNRIVAIIGSRKCTNYGIEVTKILTNLLNSYNISIISGGARGIDTVSHKTCISNNIGTICVLGCGIDVVYPKENRILFDIIQKNGLILSEFPPKTKPYKFNFPLRNRIISGLSEAVIVTEASSNSGSLITATLATEQNKKVMVVPGSIFSEASIGCNELIENGAGVLRDILALKIKLNLYNKDKISTKDKYADMISDVLSNEPMHINDIIKNTKMEYSILLKTLYRLQQKNTVVCLPGEYYAKIT